MDIGILTVPVDQAQQVCDTMVEGGIKAVWNFTPYRIRVPENVVVQNTSIYAHLAVMFNRLHAIKEGQEVRKEKREKEKGRKGKGEKEKAKANGLVALSVGHRPTERKEESRERGHSA